jgi:hypothetical protein
MTMLDATSEANNRNAFDLAVHNYKKNMELLVGVDADFKKEKMLNVEHEVFLKKSLQIFDEIATMGSNVTILKIRFFIFYFFLLLFYFVYLFYCLT